MSVYKYVPVRMFERARISTMSVQVLNIILTSYIPLFVGVPVIMTHRVVAN